MYISFLTIIFIITTAIFVVYCIYLKHMYRLSKIDAYLYIIVWASSAKYKTWCIQEIICPRLIRMIKKGYEESDNNAIRLYKKKDYRLLVMYCTKKILSNEIEREQTKLSKNYSERTAEFIKDYKAIVSFIEKTSSIL